MTYLGAIKRFGAGTQLYTFPDSVSAWSSNFGRLATQITRLPGLDGGFDQFGIQPAPSDIGTVEVSWWLTADTPAQMWALKAAVMAMPAWGKKRLFLQPYDLTLPERWCNARIRELIIPEDADRFTQCIQEVTAVFEVPEARWFSNGDASGYTIYGVSIFGSSISIYGGGPGVPYTAPTALTVNASNAGNARTPVTVLFNTGVGESLTNPKIERLVDGAAVESVEYIGTVNASSQLQIDSQRLLARVNGTDVYDDLAILRSTWISAQPGTNTYRVTSAGGADACTLKLQFDEAYYG